MYFNHYLLPRYIRLISGYSEVVLCQPLGHVIILPSPAPVLVGEAIDGLEMLDGDGGDSTKQSLVRELVVELIHSHGHVTRHGGAGVEVPVVLRQEVNVVEDLTEKGKIYFH